MQIKPDLLIQTALILSSGNHGFLNLDGVINAISSSVSLTWNENIDVSVARQTAMKVGKLLFISFILSVNNTLQPNTILFSTGYNVVSPQDCVLYINGTAYPLIVFYDNVFTDTTIPSGNWASANFCLALA